MPAGLSLPWSGKGSLGIEVDELEEIRIDREQPAQPQIHVGTTLYDELTVAAAGAAANSQSATHPLSYFQDQHASIPSESPRQPQPEHLPGSLAVWPVFSMQQEAASTGQSAEPMQLDHRKDPMQPARHALTARDIVLHIEGRAPHKPALPAACRRRTSASAADCSWTDASPQLGSAAPSPDVVSSTDSAEQLQTGPPSAPSAQQCLLTDTQRESSEPFAPSLPAATTDAEQEKASSSSATTKLQPQMCPGTPEQARQLDNAGSAWPPRMLKAPGSTGRRAVGTAENDHGVLSKPAHRFTVRKAEPFIPRRAEEDAAAIKAAAEKERQEKVEREDGEMLRALADLAGCSLEVAADWDTVSAEMPGRSSVLWLLRDLLLLLPCDSDYRWELWQHFKGTQIQAALTQLISSHLTNALDICSKSL